MKSSYCLHLVKLLLVSHNFVRDVIQSITRHWERYAYIFIQYIILQLYFNLQYHESQYFRCCVVSVLHISPLSPFRVHFLSISYLLGQAHMLNFHVVISSGYWMYCYLGTHMASDHLLETSWRSISVWDEMLAEKLRMFQISQRQQYGEVRRILLKYLCFFCGTQAILNLRENKLKMDRNILEQLP